MIKLLTLMALTLTASSNLFIKNVETKDYEINNTIMYDDGMYYATMPDENGNINNEMFVENNNISTFSYVPVIPPANDSDIYISNDEFLYNYYYHLGNNILQNKIGICGYTGIAMFLSYFDTYWDDNFIEEKYESTITQINSTRLYSTLTYQSPGVNNTLSSSPYISTLENEIIDSGITDKSSVEFKEALDNAIMQFIIGEIEKDSFAGKLFSIALENGSIIPHYTVDTYYSTPDISDNILSEGYLSGIGVNNNIMNSVLSDYVEQNEYINEKIYIRTSKIGDVSSNNETEKTRIRNEIIGLVKEGKPVLMGGNGYTDKNNNGIRDTYPKQEDGTDHPDNEGSFGHVVVAYHYDEENDVLYGNMGWGSSYSHRNLDEYFNIQMSDYWTFDIYEDLPQTYTNNYYFTDQNATYCPFENSVYNSLSPSEYGFPEAYATTEIASSIYMPSSNNNTLISFNRYRCGYIEEEAINISPRREGYSEAYLEYTLSKNVDKILVDLSFWSAKEFTNDANSEYKIEYLLAGEWIPLVDLWEDVELPTDRTNPLTVEVDFPSNTTSFRFYSWSLYTSDRNKGRLSIFDMMIIYE